MSCNTPLSLEFVGLNRALAVSWRLIMSSVAPSQIPYCLVSNSEIFWYLINCGSISDLFKFAHV